jgi:hypothetical protein
LYLGEFTGMNTSWASAAADLLSSSSISPPSMSVLIGERFVLPSVSKTKATGSIARAAGTHRGGGEGEGGGNRACLLKSSVYVDHAWLCIVCVCERGGGDACSRP